MTKTIFNLFRIKHYAKNILIFIPLLFLHEIVTQQSLLNCIFLFIAYSAMSSCIYIINDIADLKTDRLHPFKINRPLASGKVSIKNAIIISAILILLSFTFSINSLCSITLLLYFILNLCYSFLLKHILFLDVIIIALGFVLRLSAGYFAIETTPSVSLNCAVFFCSMLFTFSKRNLEIKINPKAKGYNSIILNFCIYLSFILSVVSYIIFMVDTKITNLILLAILFTIFLARITLLVQKSLKDEPITVLYKDKIIIFVIILFFVSLIF